MAAIITATDFSDVADNAIQYACDMATHISTLLPLYTHS
jgi:hypothetical protein